MQIVCVDPQTNPLWQQLIERYPSDAFHSPEWLRVLAETYGFDVRAYIMLNEIGQPKAGLPFCYIADIRGTRIVTLPFSDHCDPLVGDRDQWGLLIEPLLRARCPFTIRCLHNNIPLADDRFTLVNRAKWHGLDLQPNLDKLWAGLDSSARRAINKAQREGIVVRIAERMEDMRAFFELHLGMRKHKYRLLAQPYLFFENIWYHLVEKERGFLLTVIHEDQIIGGVLFLEWKNTLYYKFNASTPNYLSFRPNDLLIWEGIKYGKAKGHIHLDFGLSDWDQEGLARYKRKFATEEKTISFLRYAPDEMPIEQDKQMRTLLPQLTELFTDEAVPDYVTEKAGEILYRFFT